MISVIVVSILFAASVPLFAQKPYNLTVLPGNEVAVPGHLLSPGHYSLQQVDAFSTNTYRLTNEDTMQVVGVFQVIPRATHNTQSAVTLTAPDAAGLRLIKAWHPGGGVLGHEFFYSAQDLRKLDHMAKAQEQVTSSGAGQP
jgi:hypothetical protein